MNARTTVKVLRRRSITLVDRMTYVPVSRLTLNIMLNVLVSQQWLFTALCPAADYLIARTAPVVRGVRVEPLDRRFDRLHAMTAAHVGNFVFLHRDFLLFVDLTALLAGVAG